MDHSAITWGLVIYSVVLWAVLVVLMTLCRMEARKREPQKLPKPTETGLRVEMVSQETYLELTDETGWKTRIQLYPHNPPASSTSSPTPAKK